MKLRIPWRVEKEPENKEPDKKEPESEEDEDEDEEEEDNRCFEKCAWCLAWCIVVILFPCSLCFCLFVAKEFQRIVIFRLGRVRDSFGPGLVFILPCIESGVWVDIRTDVSDVEPQDMLTKDSVTINVSAVVYYSIFNPVDSIIKVDDVMEATERISQVALRNIVGSKKLHELLVSRQALSLEILKGIQSITEQWGILVERVDIMEISLPSTLERSLASEAEAVREARAKIILAEGEAKASKALKEASDVMSLNHITLQLRHLQILSALATEKRVNVIFPIPLEIMEPFFDKNVLSTIDSQDGDDRGDDSDGFTGWFTPKLYIEGSPPENFYDPEDYESDPGTLPARDSFKDPYPEPDPSAPAEGKKEDAETQTNKKMKPPKDVTDKDVVDDSKPSGSSKSPAPGKQEQAESQTKEKVEPSREGNNKDVADDSKQSGSWGLPTLFKAKSGAEDDGPSTSKQSKQAPRSQSKGPAGIEPYPLLPSTSDPRSSKRSPSPPSPDLPPIPSAPSPPALPPIPPPPTMPPIPNPPRPPPKPSSSGESPNKRNFKPDDNYYF